MCSCLVPVLRNWLVEYTVIAKITAASSLALDEFGRDGDKYLILLFISLDPNEFF